MLSKIHGTKDDPDRKHPVLDIGYWEYECPLAEDERTREGGWIDSPRELALREQKVRLARAAGDLGPSVPADVFVLSHRKKTPPSPWLTRIGGRPWRPKGRPWPKDDDGIPLAFLGQICFVDSADILPCKLPGDVALIFGTHCGGRWVSLVNGGALEWSPLEIETPEDGVGVPWTGHLPYEYHGVIHRTVQYKDWRSAAPVFEGLGYKSGGFGVHSIQATSIGTYADLPQGWPFKAGDGNTLIAALSTFQFHGAWPLCDVPSGLREADGEGGTYELFDSGGNFSIEDAGCIWIYRDKSGAFKLGGAGG